MNISILISCLSSGGAERVVCNLSNFLVNKGHAVSIITVSPERSYQLDERVKVVQLCTEHERRWNHNVLNILRIIRLTTYFLTHKPDAYLTFLPDLSRIMLSFRWLIRSPIVLAERADPATYCAQSRSHELMMKKLFSKADGYVFQTKDAQHFYSDELGIDVSDSVVIPNAINPAFVGHVYGGPRAQRIVSVGRLTEQKNFALLINAYHSVFEKLKKYDLVIYGEGSLRENLQKQINDLGLQDHVILPGRTDNIIDEIQDAALFVLPSDYEGMPNALAEAMALGLPCIATDCPAGGSRFLINNGVNGILVPVGDKEKLAEAMVSVVSDKEQAATMGENAKKIAFYLTAEKIYSAWYTFIRGVVEHY